MAVRCRACGGAGVDSARLAPILAALDAGDLDAALHAGLMDLCCPACLDASQLTAAERQRLAAAMRELQAAWAARERHRARALRLARRQAERDAARRPPPGATAPAATKATSATAAALPVAASDALARALARARGLG